MELSIQSLLRSIEQTPGLVDQIKACQNEQTNSKRNRSEEEMETMIANISSYKTIGEHDRAIVRNLLLDMRCALLESIKNSISNPAVLLDIEPKHFDEALWKNESLSRAVIINRTKLRGHRGYDTVAEYYCMNLCTKNVSLDRLFHGRGAIPASIAFIDCTMSADIATLAELSAVMNTLEPHLEENAYLILLFDTLTTVGGGAKKRRKTNFAKQNLIDNGEDLLLHLKENTPWFRPQEEAPRGCSKFFITQDLQKTVKRLDKYTANNYNQKIAGVIASHTCIIGRVNRFAKL